MNTHSTELADYLDSLKNRSRSRIDEVLEQISRSRYVCVFGMGAISKPIIRSIRANTGINIDFVCDNDPAKWGKIFHGDLRCLSPQELSRYGQEVAILITTQHYQEIRSQLAGLGLPNTFVVTEYRLLNRDFFRDPANLSSMKSMLGKAIDLFEDSTSKDVFLCLVKNWFDFDITGIGYKGIVSPDQYFPAGIIDLGDQEAFVDVGAFNGDTVFEFIRRSRERFHSIHAFELDGKNFEEMRLALACLDAQVRQRITIHNTGLLDRATEISFETGGPGSTCVIAIGQSEGRGQTVRLVDALPTEPVTFIKMDIEGAEPLALRGAEAIIRCQKPKLAICVYHKPEHLWEIPLYIKSLVPEYRLFLRHHTPMEYETVCYAI
ncbi:MAG: FkbM family methyltransferase [Candidatus Riflebacteria bacterium]|nr:FkbM family methyltransferase [Candidatus Riflebacteria bacterium]